MSEWVVTPWYGEGEGYGDARGTPRLIEAPSANDAETAYVAANGPVGIDDWLDTRPLTEWVGPTPEVLR